MPASSSGCRTPPAPMPWPRAPQRCSLGRSHEGGRAFEDELRFLVHELGHGGGYVGEINATSELALRRVTSHVPQRAVDRAYLAACKMAQAARMM